MRRIEVRRDVSCKVAIRDDGLALLGQPQLFEYVVVQRLRLADSHIDDLRDLSALRFFKLPKLGNFISNLDSVADPRSV